jgi:hypothetical protein
MTARSYERHVAYDKAWALNIGIDFLMHITYLGALLYYSSWPHRTWRDRAMTKPLHPLCSVQNNVVHSQVNVFQPVTLQG